VNRGGRYKYCVCVQDRKSRSFDSSFEDRRQHQQPAAATQHRLAAGELQRQAQPTQTAVEGDVEHRTRRRRLQETQRKSRSLDVYEPNGRDGGGAGAGAPCRAAVVARLRRSSVRATDELMPPERTQRVSRCPDTASVIHEQRCDIYLPSRPMFSLSLSLSHTHTHSISNYLILSIYLSI